MQDQINRSWAKVTAEPFGVICNARSASRGCNSLPLFLAGCTIWNERAHHFVWTLAAGCRTNTDGMASILP
eukprot:1147238-Pelagomonas_calceolata.AAC.6